MTTMLRGITLVALLIISVAGYGQSRLPPISQGSAGTKLGLSSMAAQKSDPVSIASGAVTPEDFGAACDGHTDDSVALQQWFNAISVQGGPAGYIPNVACTFTTPLTAVSTAGQHITFGSIMGAGHGSQLIYDGSSTTADIITLGNSTGVGGCSMVNWTIENLRVTSTTIMTGGDGLKINTLCDSTLQNIVIDGNLNATGRLWNGLHMAGGNSDRINDIQARAQNTAVIVNGITGYQFTDPFFSGCTIGNSTTGLVIGGFVGGMTVDNCDILENGTDVAINQSEIAAPNTQLFFGPKAMIDITTASPNIGMRIDDPGGPNSILMLTGTWLASAQGGGCLDFGSSGIAVDWQAWLNGTTINNCHGNAINTNNAGGVTMNISGGAITNTTGVGIANNAGNTIYKCGVFFSNNSGGNTVGTIGSSC